MRFFKYLLMALFFASPVAADYYEPEHGAGERKSMLDAVRARAEEQLGAPVEFIVYDLRAKGSMGFAALHAQRPGGGAIDLYATPGFTLGSIEPEYMVGTLMQALLRRSGDTWVAVHWAIGPTDVWFAYGPFCRRNRAVIEDYCAGVN